MENEKALLWIVGIVAVVAMIAMLTGARQTQAASNAVDPATAAGSATATGYSCTWYRPPVAGDEKAATNYQYCYTSGGNALQNGYCVLCRYW